MPWLGLYADEVDSASILKLLNADPEIAFIVRHGRDRWIARRRLRAVTEGKICLWHHPGGPLPLVYVSALMERRTNKTSYVEDPWKGWKPKMIGADTGTPYFGPGHPSVVWWNVSPRGAIAKNSIGLSGFEWIGNANSIIGRPAHPSTTEWWKRLRKSLTKGNRRVSRLGPLDGGLGRDVWALPSALAKLEAGVPRDF